VNQWWRSGRCRLRLTITYLLHRSRRSAFMEGAFGAAVCWWEGDHGGGHFEVWIWIETVLVVDWNCDLSRESEVKLNEIGRIKERLWALYSNYEFCFEIGQRVLRIIDLGFGVGGGSKYGYAAKTFGCGCRSVNKRIATPTNLRSTDAETHPPPIGPYYPITFNHITPLCRLKVWNHNQRV
jgi:hypothetical protein